MILRTIKQTAVEKWLFILRRNDADCRLRCDYKTV
jgi:hypothetical protein